LVSNQEYSRRIIPFLNSEYFSNKAERVVYEVITSYFIKYNKIPSIEAVAIDLTNVSLTEQIFKEAVSIVEEISKEPERRPDLEWLVDSTEKFCQERAVYNAIMQSIQIIDGKDAKSDKGAIPKILSDALAVSFDTSIGHDFIDDAEKRYEFYHAREKKVPFDIDIMNEITEGGFSVKTLNVYMAGVGVGKSMLMCHQAAYNLSRGFDVLYITMEMAEERIAERIDANLLDIPLSELRKTSKDVYDRKIARLREKVKGKLIIKEYPTAAAGSSHFRYLLNELKTKKNFSPSIIYIDYLNICASSRLKLSGSINTYTYVKSIAEEIRGLAVEFGVPIVTATQVNRTGYTDSDFGLENTSDSFGLPATADFMMALIATDELTEIDQLMAKQLKNRYSDPNRKKKFFIGTDRAKMRMYNIDQSGQEDDSPVMDKTTFGTHDAERHKGKLKDKFSEFK
jgi:replicative DNA helicase